MKARPSAADLEAARVRRARARAAVVAQMPTGTAQPPRRSRMHTEETSPVLIPSQHLRHRRGPRPGARPAAEMLGGHPRTAPLRVRRRPAAWAVALVAAAAFVLFLYALPFGAAWGWW